MLGRLTHWAIPRPVSPRDIHAIVNLIFRKTEDRQAQQRVDIVLRRPTASEREGYAEDADKVDENAERHLRDA